MLIQVLLLAAIAVVVGLAVRAPAGARHLALRRIAVLGFAVLAVLSVLFPDAWNAAAVVVGVGRGVDLLLYGLIVVVLVYMVTTYRRFREMEAKLTLLARRIAIDETFTDLGGAPQVTGSPSGPPRRADVAAEDPPSVGRPVADEPPAVPTDRREDAS